MALSDIVWAELDLHVLFIKWYAARENTESSIDPDIWRHEDAWLALIGRSLLGYSRPEKASSPHF